MNMISYLFTFALCPFWQFLYVLYTAHTAHTLHTPTHTHSTNPSRNSTQFLVTRFARTKYQSERVDHWWWADLASEIHFKSNWNISIPSNFRWKAGIFRIENRRRKLKSFLYFLRLDTVSRTSCNDDSIELRTRNEHFEIAVRWRIWVVVIPCVSMR